MARSRMWRIVLSAAAAVAMVGETGLAIDTVIRRSTNRPAAGEITSVSQTEVIVKPRVGQPTNVPANDILDVEWEAAPPSLRLARSQERGGQLEQSLKTYEQAASDNTSANVNLRAEIEFLQARVKAKLALGDPTQLTSAAEKLQSFINRNKDHYRYYEAQTWLGDVSLAAENMPAAEAAFGVLISSPWPDLQMAGKMGNARILFQQGNADGAKLVFDEVVANAVANDPATRARKLEAMLGQAQCLQVQGRNVEAIPIFGEVVRESLENDTRMQAEAYLGQGEASLAAGNSPKEAITKFLIVDVVPSLAQHGDLHAQALYHLAQLWPTVGQPVRGAEASAKLEQQYPNSEWTKKLSGGM